MADLVLVVTVKAAADVVEKLRPAMLENAAKSVQEEGCESREDENTFIFYEVYKDEDALARHRETPHFLAYLNVMQELGEKVERAAQLFDKLS
jgi:quinol monooxygenase YgiN